MTAAVGRRWTGRVTRAASTPTALMALYRAAQEGLTNVRRHADATRATVSVHCDPTGARLLVVTDDGRGFTPEQEGFGLRGMRERLRLVGGSMSVESTPGCGHPVGRGDPAPGRVVTGDVTTPPYGSWSSTTSSSSGRASRRCWTSSPASRWWAPPATAATRVDQALALGAGRRADGRADANDGRCGRGARARAGARPDAGSSC